MGDYMPKDTRMSTLDQFIGHTVQELTELVKTSTEINKHERKICAILLEYPETAPIVARYLFELNLHVGRKKEKAGQVSLEQIARALQMQDKNEHDNKLSNMLKRLS